VRLLWFAPVLLAVTLPGQGRLHPALLTRFQVVRVPLHFFDDVLLLNLPLEATQSVLEGLTILKPYFCHLKSTPLLLATKKLSLKIFQIALGAKIIIAGEGRPVEKIDSKSF
jgi:hypothetical protein